MLGAAELRDVNKLFGWGNEVVKKAVGKLLDSGKLVMAEHPKQHPGRVEGSAGEWVA